MDCFDVRDATAFNPSHVEVALDQIRLLPGQPQCRRCTGDLSRNCRDCPGFIEMNRKIKEQFHNWVLAFVQQRTTAGPKSGDCRISRVQLYAQLLIEQDRKQEARVVLIDALRTYAGLEAVVDPATGIATGGFNKIDRNKYRSVANGEAHVRVHRARLRLYDCSLNAWIIVGLLCSCGSSLG